MGLSANPFMFLSPSNGALLLLGSTGTIPIDQGHRWWTPAGGPWSPLTIFMAGYYTLCSTCWLCTR
jgi:hypothetical protein